MLRQFPIVASLCLLASDPAYSADDHPSAAAVRETVRLAGVILQHHVQPPTRQEMLVLAVRNVYREARRPVPLDLSRRFSEAVSVEELCDVMVARLDPLLAQDLISEDKLAGALREGLFAAVPGDVRLNSAENERVNEQFRSNRYVGTGIALSIDVRGPVMRQVITGGPADLAGALAGDLIETIDGESTRGMAGTRIIQLLRGPEGSDVTLALRQPDEKTPRVLTITRGVVPFETIAGYELFPAEQDGVVAYLRIDRLSASCVHELQQYAESFERDGVDGLLLDLRFTVPGDIHHAVLLADAFLDGKRIGRVRTLAGDRDYVAEPGELFRGLKLGILVGKNTRGTVEWLAAALQDARRAVVFGERTPGEALASEAFPTGREDQVLILPTALLERAGGRNLLRSFSVGQDGFPPTALRSDLRVGPQSTAWGVQPGLPVSSRTLDDTAVPAAAARRLLKLPPNPGNRILRYLAPRQDDVETDGGSPSDD